MVERANGGCWGIGPRGGNSSFRSRRVAARLARSRRGGAGGRLKPVSFISSMLVIIPGWLLISRVRSFSRLPQALGDPRLPNHRVAPSTPHEVFSLDRLPTSSNLVIPLFPLPLPPLQTSHTATDDPRTSILGQRLVRRLRPQRPHPRLLPLHPRRPFHLHQKDPSQPRASLDRRRRRLLAASVRRRRSLCTRGRLGLLVPSQLRTRSSWAPFSQIPMAAEEQFRRAVDPAEPRVVRRSRELFCATGHVLPPERIAGCCEQCEDDDPHLGV